MATMADKVAELANDDGQLFTDEFRKALEDAPNITYMTEEALRDDPVRHEWNDGSAIIVCGPFWYMGVHRSRFEEAAEHLEWDDEDGVEFALVECEPYFQSYWAEPKGEEAEVEGQPSSSPAERDNAQSIQT